MYSWLIVGKHSCYLLLLLLSPFAIYETPALPCISASSAPPWSPAACLCSHDVLVLPDTRGCVTYSLLTDHIFQIESSEIFRNPRWSLERSSLTSHLQWPNPPISPKGLQTLEVG